jgi:hypothetical protein
MRELRAASASYQRIAATLNAEHRPAKRGGQWHAQTVARVVAREGREGIA